MKYLKISNPGEIELNAFRLIGASTKRDDTSKIGFFGSGLKYSMAYLLNNNITFKIFSGEKEVVLTTKDVPYRGKDFKVILINGEETSMTTEMGPDWKSWFVVREIYCNAIDEGGGDNLEIVNEPKAKAGETSFFIGLHKDIGDLMDNWHMYFSAKRPGAVYNNTTADSHLLGYRLFNALDEKMIIYRKGIQCYCSSGMYPIFHYDFPQLTINESRTLDSLYNFNSKVVNFFFMMDDLKVIKTLLDNMCGSNFHYEKELNWHCGDSTMSELWLDAIAGRSIVIHEISGWYAEEMKSDPNSFLILPGKLAEALESRFMERVTILGEGDVNCFFKKVEKTEKQKFLLTEVEKFFTECEYNCTFPVEVVTFSNARRLGTAKEKVIYISEKLFDMGKREIAKVIIEENEHINTGFSDESRNFQNHFINKYVSTLESKYAYFL